MIGVYYMYSSSAIVEHLIDLELGEGHEFKSHLELGIFLLSFFLSFLLSFILSQWLFKYFVFSALKRVHAQIVQYAMRWEQLTISWSDILFRTHAHQGLKKLMIIMVSPVWSPSKQKRLFPCAISLNSLFLQPVCVCWLKFPFFSLAPLAEQLQLIIM